MIDKEKLKKAQEWADQASEIAQYSPTMPERARAAAEVIKSLPDTIVDGEELRGWRDKHKGNISNSGLDDMEDLLPAPPAPESASPRPEDVPEGETWLISPYGNADPVPAFRVHASKYGPGRRWAYFRAGGSMIGFADDEDVTLIARLVPETTEQDDEPAFDPSYIHPDYIYTDRDGDEWEHIDGRWISGDTHAERVATREASLGLETLPETFGPYQRDRLATPAEYGPYTRIEDTNE